MPCQDTLYQNRLDDDPLFAQACKTDCQATNAAVKAQAELCRVAGLMADGNPIGEINFVSVPREVQCSLGDEWGERVRQQANSEIAKAKAANQYLRDIGDGTITMPAAEWLVKHWGNDLSRLESENDRHKREILTPRYSSGPKHQKRLHRIAEDTPEIERLKRRIAWAEDQCKS